MKAFVLILCLTILGCSSAVTPGDRIPGVSISPQSTEPCRLTGHLCNHGKSDFPCQYCRSANILPYLFLWCQLYRESYKCPAMCDKRHVCG